MGNKLSHINPNLDTHNTRPGACLDWMCASFDHQVDGASLPHEFCDIITLGGDFFIRTHVTLSSRINRTCKKNGSKTEHVKV